MYYNFPGGVRGRVVVMCLQPPTYEILTMVKSYSISIVKDDTVLLN